MLLHLLRQMTAMGRNASSKHNLAITHTNSGYLVIQVTLSFGNWKWSQSLLHSPGNLACTCSPRCGSSFSRASWGIVVLPPAGWTTCSWTTWRKAAVLRWTGENLPVAERAHPAEREHCLMSKEYDTRVSKLDYTTKRRKSAAFMDLHSITIARGSASSKFCS